MQSVNRSFSIHRRSCMHEPDRSGRVHFDCDSSTAWHRAHRPRGATARSPPRRSLGTNGYPGMHKSAVALLLVFFRGNEHRSCLQARSGAEQVEVSFVRDQVGTGHRHLPCHSTSSSYRHGYAGLFDADSGYGAPFPGRRIPPAPFAQCQPVGCRHPTWQAAGAAVSIPAASPPQKRYVWEGVVGNTALVGPGALKV